MHSLELDKLNKCASTIKSDQQTFGIACTKTILEYEEIVIEHSTDIARLKADAGSSGVIVISNATLLTMETGKLETDLILDGVLVVCGSIVESASASGSVTIPDIATVFDVPGGMCWLLPLGGTWR